MPTPAQDLSRALWEDGPTGHEWFMEGLQMAKKKLNKGKKLAGTKTTVMVTKVLD